MIGKPLLAGRPDPEASQGGIGRISHGRLPSFGRAVHTNLAATSCSTGPDRGIKIPPRHLPDILQEFAFHVCGLNLGRGGYQKVFRRGTPNWVTFESMRDRHQRAGPRREKTAESYASWSAFAYGLILVKSSARPKSALPLPCARINHVPCSNIAEVRFGSWLACLFRTEKRTSRQIPAADVSTIKPRKQPVSAYGQRQNPAAVQHERKSAVAAARPLWPVSTLFAELQTEALPPLLLL